eukprot:TRINITY_DN3296_c0_g1_i1.p1 TRINITY_DN3296_c0_g1~~TRINITY_DN3296_c0_g1_i1.p1  ORF type:complete len:126 (+),score=27.18 TRINITY_DN3296_c0_g1_i1:174-551(+)
MSGGRISSKAPDKGSFPLDHFHECEQEAKKYNECVAKHQLMPKRCRQFQREYLECRMNKGLMDRESFERLGFTEEVSWETEEQEKKFLFNRIEEMKRKARENVQRRRAEKQASGVPEVQKPKLPE